MQIYIIILTVFVFSCIGSYVECKGDISHSRPEKLGNEFKKLDKLLSQTTTSDNAIENMEIVEKLILRAESSTFMGIKNKKNLAEAERLFLSLKKLEDEKMCNRHGFRINTNVARGIKKAGSLKRIGEVFAYYIEQQQEVCFRVFPAILREKLATMDQDKLERLDYVMQKSMNKDPRGRTDADGLFNLIRMDFVGPKVEKLYATLNNLPKEITDDSGLKIDEESEDLKNLVINRYLIEPCDHFFVNLAEDMFGLASTWVPIHTPDNSQQEFYWNWARYKFCGEAYGLLERVLSKTV